MTPGRKLAVAGTVVAAVTAYMAYVGASSSWKYYLTADECVAQGEKVVGQRMRVSGKVADGSLQIASDRRRADFVLQGTVGSLTVACSGALPDNLTDGMEVVVEGRLESAGRLTGDKVLTRCASKYESQPAAVPASIPAQEASRGP
jgi:cytochrome c-type biogenesis protein CcmE